MQKKIVDGDYIDPETGIRFVEDIRGNLHFIPATTNIVEQSQEPSPTTINVIVQNNETLENEKKRYRRILERLRMENNWLWYILEKAIREGKKNSKTALASLEKAVNERTR